MMNEASHAKTKVQPGRRILLDVPHLTEGQDVEVIVLVPAGGDKVPTARSAPGIADLLKSFSPSKRTDDEWRALDDEFKRDREEWER